MTTPLITGSYVDIVHGCPRDGVYWNRKTLAYTEADWAALVRHVHRDVGVEVLVLQNVARANEEPMTLYPSRHIRRQWPTGCSDPVGAIVRACRAEGVALFMGFGYIHDAFTNFGFGDTTDEALAWYLRTADELLERYGDGAPFAGFYVTPEMPLRDGQFPPAWLAFTRRLTDGLRGLAPRHPILGAPAIRGAPVRTETLARQLAETGFSIIAYQDGMGFGTRAQPIDPSVNGPHYEALRRAHDRAGIALWANIETFCFENDIHFQPLIPAPFERVRRQLEAAAPFVERVIAYTVPGLMTSQAVCPGLGTPETEALYAAYTAYRRARLGRPA
ncbi:MAG: DUF4434 domain-containing protein [Lentisphaerae bacterium]|nr:DUF4434 domain-containing protein [Lentisphaerota bacterium]